MKDIWRRVNVFLALLFAGLASFALGLRGWGLVAGVVVLSLPAGGLVYRLLEHWFTLDAA